MQQLPAIERSWVGKSHDYREVVVLKKLRFQNVSCLHENEKS